MKLTLITVTIIAGVLLAVVGGCRTAEESAARNDLFASKQAYQDCIATNRDCSIEARLYEIDLEAARAIIKPKNVQHVTY